MQKSSTDRGRKSTPLRRAFNPGLARALRLDAVRLGVGLQIRTEKPRPIKSDEEVFGPAIPCGYCSQPTEEFFLRSGLCPDCQGFARFCTQNGHSAC